MLANYTQYKAHVAPIYQNEIDRHLFATASYHPRNKRSRDSKGASASLRNWISRWSRWKDERENTGS